MRMLTAHLSIIQSGTTDLEKKAFWMDMGNELFQSVRTLYDQILAQFTDRAPDDGPGGQMAASRPCGKVCFSRWLTLPYSPFASTAVVSSPFTSASIQAVRLTHILNHYLVAVSNWLKGTLTCQSSLQRVEHT